MKIKKFTPEQLIEILVENPKGFLDQEEVKIPDDLVLVYPTGGRHKAKVFLLDGVPTVQYHVKKFDTIHTTELQLVDSGVIFEEFVTRKTNP